MSVQEFSDLWSNTGPALRANRHLQIRGGGIGVARDEIWPLVHFLRHTGQKDSVEFKLTAANTSGCDVVVFSDNAGRCFEIKTTGPLWPRPDGTIAHYGLARKELILSLGSGVENLGPLQSLLLGDEFADNEEMIPKDRLLRAAVVGIRNAFEKIRDRYTEPVTYRGGDVELLLNVWGISHYFVTPKQFGAVVRLCKRSAPKNHFSRVHVFGSECGQYVEL